MTVENEGRVVDITDLYLGGIRWDLEAAVAEMDVSALKEIHANDRRFRIYCGGCPYAAESWVPGVVVEDTAMFDSLVWVEMFGFQVNPIRCPYCTGQMQRPDGPDAAPYPVVTGG